jgi:hypothetical protein
MQYACFAGSAGRVGGVRLFEFAVEHEREAGRSPVAEMRFFAGFLRIAKTPPQKRDQCHPVWIGYAP